LSIEEESLAGCENFGLDEGASQIKLSRPSFKLEFSGQAGAISHLNGNQE
jgi:hypothetical protein